MKAEYLAITLLLAPCVAFGAGLDTIFRVVDGLATGKMPTAPVDETTPDVCIGPICLGDTMSEIDKNIAVVEARAWPSDQEIYQSQFKSCESQRLKGLQDAKLTRQQLVEISKNSTNARVRSQANAQVAHIDNAIKGNFTSESCKEYAADAVTRHNEPIIERHRLVREFVAHWGAESGVDIESLISRNPDISVVSENNEIGGGVLVLSAKTNLGSYKDVEALVGSCQPVALIGLSADKSTEFVALNDPEHRQFYVVALGTIFLGMNADQKKSIETQYEGKFGRFTESGTAMVYVADLGDAVSVSAIHPSIGDNHSTYRIGEEDYGASIKGQFKGIARNNTLVELSGGKLIVIENSGLPAAYAQLPRCKAIREKAAHVQIR